MATYAVGDIQGCLGPLQCLLEAVNFDPARDTLWCVGDAVNRGPRCLDTLRFLYAMRDSLVMVLGNHDLHLLAVAAGARKLGRGDTLEPILLAEDREQLLSWLLHRPLLHREHGFTLVHAGIPPQWTVAQAEAYAAEVETALRGPQCMDFFRSMYGNEPPVWSDDLQGMARLRVITNYLTRMRYCTRDGVLDLVHKGPDLPAEGVEISGRKVSAWFSHRKRSSAGEKIIFGHWASLQGRTDSADVIGLDTGCVWDGSMSLYQLDNGALIGCDCQDGDCAP